MKMDPATTFVRSLDGNYYMVREAAELLGINHRTLRNWNEGSNEKLKPSFVSWLGKVKIYLYTDDDIDKIREYLDDRRKIYPNDDKAKPQSGRPARYSKEERKERQKLYSKAHYYGRRAKEETDKGDLRKATEYLTKQRKVKKELEEWTTESLSESRTKPPSTETAPGSSSSTAPTFRAASTETPI